MKFLINLSLFTFLAGCSLVTLVSQPTVSSEDLSEFFEALPSGDYHRIVRTGKQVFQEGQYIPQHYELFRDYPSDQPEGGLIRYILFRFRGEASLGEVYIILEQETGKIIEFNYFEAWFES